MKRSKKWSALAAAAGMTPAAYTAKRRAAMRRGQAKRKAVDRIRDHMERVADSAAPSVDDGMTANEINAARGLRIETATDGQRPEIYGSQMASVAVIVASWTLGQRMLASELIGRINAEAK